MAKLDVFQEDTSIKLKEAANALAHLQRENVGMQRRITESVSTQNFEMQLALFHS